jgi:hypothetical protein
VRLVAGRTLVVALSTLLALTGCHAGTRRPPSASAPPSGAAATAADPCAARPTREPCASIRDGGRAQRYALIRRGHTARTVVVDLGGPGLSVLSGAFSLGSFGADEPGLRGYNLLFLEEPWVTAATPARCDTALTEFYRSLRDDPAQLPVTVVGLRAACFAGPSRGSWGFEPDRYIRALRAISSAENLELTGFLGYSFGDVRYAYAQELGFRWAVFVRPYPLGVAGAEIVAARARAVTTVLARARKLRPQRDATSAPRSLPVVRFDSLSAQVALSYLDETGLARYGPEVMDGTNTARIGSLSDDLWKRYGIEQLSPGYLAYLEEVCRSTPGWPAVRAIDTPADVIVASTSPCALSSPVRQSIGGHAAVCVVTSRTDPVLPAALVQPMLAAHRAWRQVSSGTSEHASSDGVGECLASVGNSS